MAQISEDQSHAAEVNQLTEQVVAMAVTVGEEKTNDKGNGVAGASNNPQRQLQCSPLPNEITTQIFKHLVDDEDDICAATCFALTSKSHYKIFRSVFGNGRISLDRLTRKTLEEENRSIESKQGSNTIPVNVGGVLSFYLRDLLKAEFSDKYRLVGPNKWLGHISYYMFVSRAVYSDTRDSAAEKKLKSRWFDYHILGGGRSGFLPSPFGLGENWYPRAAKEIQLEVACWGDSDGWNLRMKKIWEYYERSCLRAWIEREHEGDLSFEEALKVLMEWEE